MSISVSELFDARRERSSRANVWERLLDLRMSAASVLFCVSSVAMGLLAIESSSALLLKSRTRSLGMPRTEPIAVVSV